MISSRDAQSVTASPWASDPRDEVPPWRRHHRARSETSQSSPNEGDLRGDSPRSPGDRSSGRAWATAAKDWAAARVTASRTRSSPIAAIARATGSGSSPTGSGSRGGTVVSGGGGRGGREPTRTRIRRAATPGTARSSDGASWGSRRRSSCAQALDAAWTTKTPRRKRAGHALRATRGGTFRSHHAQVRTSRTSSGSPLGYARGTSSLRAASPRPRWRFRRDITDMVAGPTPVRGRSSSSA